MMDLPLTKRFLVLVLPCSENVPWLHEFAARFSTFNKDLFLYCLLTAV
jgi:hypothetical protein